MFYGVVGVVAVDMNITSGYGVSVVYNRGAGVCVTGDGVVDSVDVMVVGVYNDDVVVGNDVGEVGDMGC